MKEPETEEKKPAAGQATATQKPVTMQAGKRYKCTQCGSEMLVIKPGKGTLRCCGQDMQLK